MGATGEDSNGNQADNSESASGAAYVFTRTGTTWAQQAYIKSSNSEGCDQFGFSVAINGNTLAVGANGESGNATGINGNQADNSAVNAGAVYVFTRTGISWTQQAYIKASNTEGGDWFGYSIAISGETLAIGAIFEDSNATGINGNQNDNSEAQSGAVYVFTRTGISWAQEAYIKASDPDSGDWFGWSVSLSDNTLAVGAYLEDSNATDINGNDSDDSAADSGAVYVFK